MPALTRSRARAAAAVGEVRGGDGMRAPTRPATATAALTLFWPCAGCRDAGSAVWQARSWRGRVQLPAWRLLEHRRREQAAGPRRPHGAVVQGCQAHACAVAAGHAAGVRFGRAVAGKAAQRTPRDAVCGPRHAAAGQHDASRRRPRDAARSPLARASGRRRAVQVGAVSAAHVSRCVHPSRAAVLSSPLSGTRDS